MTSCERMKEGTGPWQIQPDSQAINLTWYMIRPKRASGLYKAFKRPYKALHEEEGAESQASDLSICIPVAEPKTTVNLAHGSDCSCAFVFPCFTPSLARRPQKPTDKQHRNFQLQSETHAKFTVVLGSATGLQMLGS